MGRYLQIVMAMIAAQLAAGQIAPSTQPASTQPSSTQPSSESAFVSSTLVWNEVDEKQRAAVIELLNAPAWPIRVFALLRMERFTGDAVKSLMLGKLHDNAWQARCFALRQCQRLGVPVAAADLADEADPRVIRAALRAGVSLPDKKVRDMATKLLQARNIDDVMLGMEIGAACSIESNRKDTAAHAVKLIQNMDNSVSALVSRRLAAVLIVADAPASAPRWRAWLHSQKDTVQLVSPRRGFPNGLASKPSLVSQMDDETFARLLDYLGSLKQRDLDLVIVMDATASMIPMVDQARAGIDSLILFLSDISREMRLAFVAYRDHDNKPVWDGHPFTTDINSIRDYLFKLRITGGADYPEAVFEGLAACAELKWNKKATREIVLVGDAPPHEEDVYRIHALMDSYRDLGITVHAAHIPMEFPRGHIERMPPDKAIEARQWLTNYNNSTSESFADIASAGGGRKTEMNQPDELVPAIMHFTIEDGWWEAFDEFYAMYVALCR